MSKIIFMTDFYKVSNIFCW